MSHGALFGALFGADADEALSIVDGIEARLYEQFEESPNVALVAEWCAESLQQLEELVHDMIWFRFCAVAQGQVLDDLLGNWSRTRSGLTDDQISERTFYRGRGCEVCQGTGFKGRKGIFEIMVMNNRLREMTFMKDTTDNLRNQALNDGMHTLFMDGLRKVLDGKTGLEEVLAAAKMVG